MDKYMVIYYNGNGMRERYFNKKEEAIKFLSSCGDDKATIWVELQLD